MNALRWGLATVVFGFGLTGLAQFQPPAAVALEDKDRDAIEARVRDLTEQVAQLAKQGVRDPVLGEVEIYPRAVKMVLQHGEFYTKNYAAWMNDVLDRGYLRAGQAKRGDAPWLQQSGQAVVRAYRSRIDGTVQPYAVTFPHENVKVPGKQLRLDIVLHGRDSKLTEVSFLKTHEGTKAAPKELGHVRLDIFGRGNNAYRWAGETDVFEALEQFLAVEASLGRAGQLDLSKVVLRGFSMGGAGAWHIGLHHPDRWCAVGPGAGFATTRGYIKDLPKDLPAYLEQPLHIYDAVDYAENAASVPVIAYAGGDDPQQAAGKAIGDRLQGTNIALQFLIAPGVGHAVPEEYAKKLEAEYAKAAEKGRSAYPKRVRFDTWTLKYDRCDWVHLLALEEHYKRASVEAEVLEAGDFKLKADNVRALSLRLPPGAIQGEVGIKIAGGGTVVAKPSFVPGTPNLAVYLEKREGKWVSVLPEYLALQQARQVQKVRGQTGPIDDAFTDAFLCVRGTGKPWHEATQQYAEADLTRFTSEWSKFLRGTLPVKNDEDVTPEDIATRHLILFGDPASNSLIAQVLPGLPLKWTKERITLGSETFASNEHVPVTIYPSPLAAGRYVVLNSGHTFHAAEFTGTNAQLYPRLGDYAVLKVGQGTAMTVAKAGLYDDYWRLPK